MGGRRVVGQVARALTTAIAIAWLTACSSPPPATFDLGAAPRPAAPMGRGQLAVAEPQAVTFLDSERMAVRTSGNTIAYLPGGQWADRLPKLVQARLIESFENARRIRSVARPGGRIMAAHQLNSDIRTFEVQEASREAVVEITARIVNDRTGQIVAAEQFAARAPVESIDAAGAAKALDAASQKVLADLVRWVSERA
ncbi:MAG TPA: ABC-type transport auxiliary lipoprotein family protein [Beijerinckiaceae bacterium]|nr:ABC-type transport auxiliary lipoprotein family protein [Beijerinckiaceae bacterium]